MGTAPVLAHHCQQWDQLPAWPPAPAYLHELQVLEGGELPWDLNKLVSIQVAARENKSTSRWLKIRRSLPLPPILLCTFLCAAKSISIITSLPARRAWGSQGTPELQRR